MLMFRCLLAGSLAVMVAPSAWAQAADPASSAAFHRGAFGFTPTLTMPAIGTESNVFNEATNPRSDLSANVQPQLDAWVRAGKARLDLKEQVNLIYYEKYSSERSVNISSTVRLDVVMHRVSPYAALVFLRTNDRTSAEVDTRARHRSVPINAGVDIRLTAKTTFAVGGDYETLTFDEAAVFQGAQLKRELDSSTIGSHASLRYTVTPKTSVTLTATKQEVRYKFSPKRDNATARLLPGIEFSPTALISGRADVGFLSFSPKDPEIRTFKGLVMHGDLGYVMFGVTRFGVQMSRDVTPSINKDETYFVQTGVGASVTHRISERWDAGAGGNRQRLGYGAGRLLPDGSSSNRPDFVSTYYANVGFYFARGLRLGVRAESVRRDSVLPISNYKNRRLTSSFTYGFR